MHRQNLLFEQPIWKYFTWGNKIHQWNQLKVISVYLHWWLVKSYYVVLQYAAVHVGSAFFLTRSQWIVVYHTRKKVRMSQMQSMCKDHLTVENLQIARGRKCSHLWKNVFVVISYTILWMDGIRKKAIMQLQLVQTNANTTLYHAKIRKQI